MSTSLLVHPSGLSLVSLSKSLAVTAQTPLSLASRFPKNATPSVVVSERTGHAWVWSKETSVVWEYDARARRISEFSAGGKVTALCWTMSESGKDSVVASIGGEVKVMEKEGGKCDCVRTISVSRTVAAVAAASDGRFLSMVDATGTLSIYDRNAETRRTVSLPAVARDLSPSLMRFAPTMPRTLLLPAGEVLFLIDAESHAVTELNPSGSRQRILDICFSPVVQGSNGERKGGLCGVLLDGGEVALLGLDQPDSTPKMISFGQQLSGISFIDGASIAGCTNTGGKLLIKDLRALSEPPVEVAVSDSVVRIHTVPLMPRSASRSSLAPSASAASIKRTPFGETRNFENLPTPPPVPELHKNKGKAREISRTVEISETESVRTAEIHIPASRTSDRRASHTGATTTTSKTKTARIVEPQEKVRNVSAPTASGSSSRPASRARASMPAHTSRSASGSAVSGPSSHAPRASVAHLASEAIIEEEDEDTTARVVEDETDAGAGLEWALKSPASRPTVSEMRPEGKIKAGMEAEIIENLRRDMWGLQMDMLRMNRHLRNEIRSAVEPLKAELEANRLVIETQRREIERLRRGY